MRSVHKNTDIFKLLPGVIGIAAIAAVVIWSTSTAEEAAANARNEHTASLIHECFGDAVKGNITIEINTFDGKVTELTCTTDDSASVSKVFPQTISLDR